MSDILCDKQGLEIKVGDKELWIGDSDPFGHHPSDHIYEIQVSHFIDDHLGRKNEKYVSITLEDPEHIRTIMLACEVWLEQHQ